MARFHILRKFQLIIDHKTNKMIVMDNGVGTGYDVLTMPTTTEARFLYL